MQTDKLKKLLALTTSDNDNEALAAIRQANKILKDADKTWDEVLEADLTEANKRYEQLVLVHNALARKYNELVQMIANQRAAAAVMMPRINMPRRRSRRF